MVEVRRAAAVELQVVLMLKLQGGRGRWHQLLMGQAPISQLAEGLWGRERRRERRGPWWRELGVTGGVSTGGGGRVRADVIVVLLVHVAVVGLWVWGLLVVWGVGALHVWGKARLQVAIEGLRVREGEGVAMLLARV